MKVRRVTWEIEELDAQGSDGIDRADLQDAARSELEHLLSPEGMPSWLSRPTEIEGFKASAPLTQTSKPRTRVAQQLALAVFGGPRS